MRERRMDQQKHGECAIRVVAERALKLGDEETPETPQRSPGRRRILMARLSHVGTSAATIPMPWGKHESKKFVGYREGRRGKWSGGVKGWWRDVLGIRMRMEDGGWRMEDTRSALAPAIFNPPSSILRPPSSNRWGLNPNGPASRAWPIVAREFVKSKRFTS